MQNAIIAIIAEERTGMPAVTVRKLSEKTHRALKLRAARNGRSTEAEIRVILNEAVARPRPLNIGSELAKLGRRFGGIELDITRDKRPAEPAKFS
jgi:antitoxin FitA